MIGSLHTDEERTFLEKLTWLLSGIINSKLAADAEDVTRMTQGMTIPKKDSRPRPLGLRETLVNLACKSLLQMLKDKVTPIFDGVNYALAGRKKMDELIALMNHAMLARPDHDRLFIDAKNAFNECRRDKAAEAILKHCPELANIFFALYGKDTKVWLRADRDDWTTLLAQEGCIQGCVLGPLVFGFSTKEAYDRVCAILRGCLDCFFVAFSDDSAISADHDPCVEAFMEYLEAGKECGLKVNFAINKTVVLLGKCADEGEVEQRIANFNDIVNIPRANIRIHPDNGGDPLQYGYVYLGIPIGSDEFKKLHLRKMIDEYIDDCKCDSAVKSPQEKWVYLYWVIRQKFPFWLRHMSPTITNDFARDIDQHLRVKLSNVIGEPISDDIWNQARLPVKSHGFGLGHVEDTISAAYVANVMETQTAVLDKLPSATYLNHLNDPQEELDAIRLGSAQIEEFVDVFRTHNSKIKHAANTTGVDISGTFATHLETRKLQFLFTKVFTTHRVCKFEQHIAAHGSPADKARIFSNDGSFAGAWLFSVPKNDKSIIAAETFRKCCRLRLGMAFNELPTTCCCRGHKVIDRTNPCHFWACPEFKHLCTDRHNAIQAEIKALANSAGLRVDDRKLTVFRVTNDDDGKRPDLLIPTMGEDGRNLLVDITIGHPTCPSYVTQAARTRHYTLNELHRRKNVKYLQRCTEINSSFMPLAFESFGAVSADTVTLIAKLVSKAAELSNIPYSVLLSYWRKRISTTLQVQNARILMLSATRILAKSGADEAFDMNALLESVHNH